MSEQENGQKKSTRRSILWVVVLGITSTVVFVTWRTRVPTDDPLGIGSGNVAVFRSLGVHDFGVVDGAQEFPHRFRVQNDTSVTWTFKSSHVNCGCVRIESVSETVEPGEYLVVDATLATEGIGGVIERSLQVVMHPEDKLFEAVILARVLTPPHATPASLTVGLDSADSEYTAYTEVVIPGTDDAIRVTGTGTGPEQTVTFSKANVSDLGTTFVAEIRGSLPIAQSELSERIFVQIEGCDMGSQIEIPIMIRRNPDIAISPRVLLITRDREGTVCLKTKESVQSLSCRVEPATAAKARLEKNRLTIRPSENDELSSFRIVLSAASGERAELPVHIVPASAIP